MSHTVLAEMEGGRTRLVGHGRRGIARRGWAAANARRNYQPQGEKILIERRDLNLAAQSHLRDRGFATRYPDRTGGQAYRGTAIGERQADHRQRAWRA